MADTITDDQLDQLYAELTRLRAELNTMTEVARGNKRHVQRLTPDLIAAEAALARVRAVADRWVLPGHISMPTAAADIRAALDSPTPNSTPCPTECDADCDTGCHEDHAVPWKRRHDPATCPGTTP